MARTATSGVSGGGSGSGSDSGMGSAVLSLPPPRPKSPPDLYGRRKDLARIKMLEREKSLLEEELKFVESLQPASRCCKEVVEYVTANGDPLIPTNKKISKTCRLWKWLCGSSCFSLSWICCCTPCSINPKIRAPKSTCCCSMPDCCSCITWALPKCSCWCKPTCNRCCPENPCLKDCCSCKNWCSCNLWQCFSCYNCCSCQCSCPRCTRPKCSCPSCSCTNCSCPNCSCVNCSCPKCSDVCGCGCVRGCFNCIKYYCYCCQNNCIC